MKKYYVCPNNVDHKDFHKWGGENIMLCTKCEGTKLISFNESQYELFNKIKQERDLYKQENIKLKH